MSASKEGAQSGSGAKCSPVELNTDQTFARCWDRDEEEDHHDVGDCGDDHVDTVMMMTISVILLVLIMMSIRFYQGTSSHKFVKY